MRGFIQCTLVAVSALSIVCEGYTPARVRGLQTNSTAVPANTNMAMVAPKSMANGNHTAGGLAGTGKGAKGADKGTGGGVGMPKGKSGKSDGKSEMSKMGKSSSAKKSSGMKMMGSKSGKGYEDMGGTNTTKPVKSVKGKGKGAGKGKGSGMSKKMSMKQMMMGKGKGKGLPGGTLAPTTPGGGQPGTPTRAPVLQPGETRSPTMCKCVFQTFCSLMSVAVTLIRLSVSPSSSHGPTSIPRACGHFHTLLHY